ncbi:MAG: hypothetical protein ABI355_19255 [Solirubrobacteraceae bacterium]
MATGTYPGPRPDRATAQRKREAALARLTRVRTITIVGAGALTAVVAGVVSSASGRTLGAKYVVRTAAAAPRAAAPSSRTGKLPPLASAGQLGLGGSGGSSQPNPGASAQAQAAPQAPAAAPQSVAPQAAPAPAVSGGS